MSDWTFLSNHGIALICVAQDPGMTLREIGDYVGVTERTAHSLVNDLVADGYLKRYREGNRNRYEIDTDKPLRPPLMGSHTVGEIVAVLAGQQGTRAGDGERADGARRRRRKRAQ